MNMASPGYGQFNMPTTPNVRYSQQNTDITTVLNMLLSRMDNIDKQMGQLETIQSAMNTLTVKCECMDKKVSQIEIKIKEIEQSRENDGTMLENLNKKQKEIELLTGRLKDHEHLMQHEVTDLKCGSMRDNLLFFKIPEEKDEQCEKKILDFMESKLRIENASRDIKLHRVHRIGRYNSAKIRPIVAKFAYYPDREQVRKASKELKGTPYGISEQYPREVMETRQKLIPIMKKVREENKEAYLRVDKLFIDGREYKPNA